MLNTWKQLYPNGHAFNVSDNTNRAKIHNSTNVVYNDYLDQSKSLVNGALAKDGISEEEISFLENIYGVYFVDGLTIEERLNRVRLRMTYPNGIVNRSSAAWIEHVLMSFGFDVRIIENTGEIPPQPAILSRTQYGTTNYGINNNLNGFKYNVIANSMFENEIYSFGGKLWATFFINIITPIEPERINEFRELVLKLKPAHLCAIVTQGFGNGDFNDDFSDDFDNEEI